MEKFKFKKFVTQGVKAFLNSYVCSWRAWLCVRVVACVAVCACGGKKKTERQKVKRKIAGWY
jgi:hypothetical protein